jgi:hypothetical protein
VAEQSAPSRWFIPEFLSSKFLSSLSEFLSFGFSLFGFRASDFLRISGFGFRIFLLPLACFLTAPTIFAQSNSVINVGPGGRLIIATPGGGQMVITGQNVIRFLGGQPVLDPQIAAAMQMSANEPGFAQAEFDPPVVPLGGSATYRVVLVAMPEGASLPELLPVPAGLELKRGGRNFTYGPGGSGGIQPRTTFNFRVTAQTNGVVFMPAFQASAEGRSVTVPEASLAVLPADMPTTERAPQLIVKVPPGDYFVGQSVPVQVALLDPGDHRVAGLSQVQASGDAFIAEGGARWLGREVRNINGVPTDTHIAELIVTPVKDGRLALKAQAAVVLNRPANPAGISLPGYQPLYDAEPAMVSVRLLPKAGQLPGFTGAIGRFELDPPAVSVSQVRVGGFVTLMVVVRGEGNFSRFTAPKLTRADGWQVFTPSVGAAQNMPLGQPGMAVFKYTLIPTSPQVKATPAIPFSYFDPVRQVYVDITVPPVPVQVTGTAGTVVSAGTGGPEAEDEATEAAPVLADLVPTPGPVSSLTPMQQRGWFFVLQLLPLGGLAGWWAWSKRRLHLAAHPEIARRRRALRGLRRQGRLVRSAAAAGDAAGFVRASVQALREAAAPYAAAQPEALVCSDVLAALPVAERQGEAGRLIRKLFLVADESQFVDREPEAAAMLAMQPEVSRLLEEWRRRL